jgi:hypothetical protein
VSHTQALSGVRHEAALSPSTPTVGAPRDADAGELPHRSWLRKRVKEHRPEPEPERDRERARSRRARKRASESRGGGEREEERERAASERKRERGLRIPSVAPCAEKNVVFNTQMRSLLLQSRSL